MITAMGDVMRRAYEKGWITTRDGNISLRRSGSNIMYVTPSGWRKTIIHPEHMIKIKLYDNMGIEAMEILDVKNVIASILLVEDLRIQKN